MIKTDLIDRGALKEKLSAGTPLGDALSALLDMEPSVVDVEPVRHGEWIVDGGMVICSECFEPNIETDYCPNCGAKMDTCKETN